MNKSELIRAAAKDYPSLSQSDVALIVDVIFKSMTASLVRGERIEFRGFGAFTVRHRQARLGRNPQTGETFAVPEKMVPFFSAAQNLLARFNVEQANI